MFLILRPRIWRLGLARRDATASIGRSGLVGSLGRGRIGNSRIRLSERVMGTEYCHGGGSGMPTRICCQYSVVGSVKSVPWHGDMMMMRMFVVAVERLISSWLV